MAYFEKVSISENLQAAQSSELVDSQAVQDVGVVDGASQIELLSLILLELRILNQQMYELPGLFAQGLPSKDPPESFRNDNTIFKT
jgi:hypothetical protein